MASRVLVVTKRTAFAEPLSVALRAGGLDYFASRSLTAARDLVEQEFSPSGGPSGEFSPSGGLGGELPAAIVVDLFGAEGDIARLCETIRARADGDGVPIVLCGTGHEGIKSTSDALIAGGDGYFALPCPAQRILAKLSTYLACSLPDLPPSLVLPGEEVALEQGVTDATQASPSSHEITPDGLDNSAERIHLPPSDVVDDSAPMPPAPRPVSGVEDAPVFEGTASMPVFSDVSSGTPAFLASQLRSESHSEARPLPGDTTLTALRPPEEVTAEGTTFSDELVAVSSDVSGLFRSAEREAATSLARLRPPSRALDAAQIEKNRAELEQLRLAAEDEVRAAAAARAAAEVAAAQELQRLQEQAEAERLRVEAVMQAAREREAEEALRLAALAQQREAVEKEAAQLAQEREAKFKQEEERIAALMRERAQQEAALATKRRESEQAHVAEKQRLQQLAQERERLESLHQQTLQDVRKKEEAESARLAELVAQRAAAEAQTQRVMEAIAAREMAAKRSLSHTEQLLEAEAKRLSALEADRQRLESEGQAAEVTYVEQSTAAQRRLEELKAKLAQEQARLKAIEEDRASEAQQMDAAQQSARSTEQNLAAELFALEQRHAQLQREAEAQAQAHARKFADEESALRALEAARAQQERDMERRLEVLREAEANESQRLAEIAARRAAAEQQSTETLHRLRQSEAIERERLARTAAEQQHAEAELAALIVRQQHAAAEEQERLDQLAFERTQAEARAEKLLADLQARLAAETEQLEAVSRAQQAAEAQTAALLREREHLIALEEERLRALREHHAHLLQEQQEAAAAQAKVEEDTQAHVAALREARAQAERDAEVELEHLRRVRAEEELARREREEKRTRARLAFAAGRLDAPDGEAVSSDEVGATKRPLTDALGHVLGGGAVVVSESEAAPPPPPAFVAPEPQTGRCQDGELPALLWSAHLLQVTGAIDITADDGRTRTLFLEHGEPVLVSSTLTVDRPEESLLRAGFITLSRYNVLRASAVQSARRMAAALVADGDMKTEELFVAVRGVLVEQVLSLCEWGDCSFQYHEALAHAADRVRLEYPLSTLLAEGVRRKFDERRLWHVLGGPATLIGPYDVQRALPPLSPEEKLAVARLDGTRSLEDIVLETHLPAASVLRAALVTVSCGVTRVIARGRKRDAHAAQEAHANNVAIDRARIRDKLQVARHGDYYTFLGVDAHASAFEVKRAAERLRTRFDPARYSDPAYADLRQALAEICEVTIDAESVLADAALADGYRRSLLDTAGTPRRRHAS